MRNLAMKFAIAALITSAPIPAMATAVYQTFGTLPVTFGGSGIPNNAVAASSVFVNGNDQIVLGLTAHGRYSNPTVTNNGAGVFYAGSGSNCGIATDPVGCPSSSQGALWNFGFFVGVSGPSADLSDYNFNLYYDFNPGANTPVGSLGVINVNNAIIAVGGNPSIMTVAQDSQNLLFSSFSTTIPGVITPPGGAFNPNALGEYSFYLTATTKTAFPASVGTVGIDVQVVPVPAAAWLLGSGLIGLAGFARKRKPV